MANGVFDRQLVGESLVSTAFSSCKVLLSMRFFMSGSAVKLIAVIDTLMRLCDLIAVFTGPQVPTVCLDRST